VRWQGISIKPHEQQPVYLDLDEALFHFAQAVGYLRTEIISDRQKPARLEIYTDDGVKTRLNGKQIHAMNVARGIPKQPDTVDIVLNEVVNRLMLKVTDGIFSWPAIVRLRSDEQAVSP
jgi:hypothetical protein